MPPSPFKPRQRRKPNLSNNRKTVLNRMYDANTRGLDIALRRADTNFRTSKSRALKKLHAKKNWCTLSDAQKAAMEKEVVEDLVKKRDNVKASYEREWFSKVERGDVEEDEDDLTMDLDEFQKDKYLDGGDDNEIVALSSDPVRKEASQALESGDNDEWEDIESDEETLDQRSVRDILEIRKKSGLAWMAKMKAFEEQAAHKWVEAE